MKYISAALWLLVALELAVLIIRTFVKTVKSRNNGDQEKILSSQEKKIWICSIIAILLLSRFLIVYSSVFHESPNIRIGITEWKNYLWCLFLSFVWPPQLPVLLSSIAILTTNHALERSKGRSRPIVRFNIRVFIGTCSTYFSLVVAGVTMYHLSIINIGVLYFILLYGKCVAMIILVLSLSEQAHSRQGDE